MKKPPHVIEIFLQPGDFYFGDRDTRIRTLLGSCVSISMWHPRLLIGGMCHFLLPSRGAKGKGAFDGRYAEEAMSLFMQEIRAAGTRPSEYQVKLFGGGNMFPGARKGVGAPLKTKLNPEDAGCSDVPCRNREAARQLVQSHGFSITAEHLGGAGHRQILFDIWSGHVWVRHSPVMTSCVNGMAA